VALSSAGSSASRSPSSVIIPFTSDAELSAKVGTAAINLAIGIAIYSIVSGVGRSAAQARTF
jgi:hypothetical protein